MEEGLGGLEGDLWDFRAQAWELRLANSPFKSQRKFAARKNILFKSKIKVSQMSLGIHLVIFPETMSRAGELMLKPCQEVPVEMPPLGVWGYLALHWLLWPGKGSVLMGLLFLPSGGAVGTYRYCRESFPSIHACLR